MSERPTRPEKPVVSEVLRHALRRAEPRDAGAVADVWLTSRAAAIGSVPPPVHPEPAIRAWIADHVVAEGECWVAELPDGQIAAMLALEETWIDQLYVAPECQGSGIGSALVELAKTRSPDRLQLWTFETNSAAQRFYERHGFVCVERTDGSGNEERAPDRRYLYRPAIA